MRPKFYLFGQNFVVMVCTTRNCVMSELKQTSYYVKFSNDSCCNIRCSREGHLSAAQYIFRRTNGVTFVLCRVCIMWQTPKRCKLPRDTLTAVKIRRRPWEVMNCQAAASYGVMFWGCSKRRLRIHSLFIYNTFLLTDEKINGLHMCVLSHPWKGNIYECDVKCDVFPLTTEELTLLIVNSSFLFKHKVYVKYFGTKNTKLCYSNYNPIRIPNQRIKWKEATEFWVCSWTKNIGSYFINNNPFLRTCWILLVLASKKISWDFKT